MIKNFKEKLFGKRSSAKDDHSFIKNSDGKNNFVIFVSLSLPILIFVLSLVIVYVRFAGPVKEDKKPIAASTSDPATTNSETFPDDEPSVTPLLEDDILRPEILEEAAQGKLAFIEDGDISLVNADRTGYEKLTEDEFNKFSPAVSPDGKKIAYGFYPKDESKRSNQGYYVGFHSGISIVDVATGKIKTLIKYEPTQNHYPYWLPDSKFLTVWVGNGSGAKLIDTDTSTVVQNIDEPGEVSPIVWVPGKRKISFIADGTLYISEIDGSGKNELMNGVAAYRQVHEGPNVPEPPGWSNTGKYVTYYKDADFYVLDVDSSKETLLGKGSEDDGMFGSYPQVYLLGFSEDDKKIFMLDYGADKYNIAIHDLETDATTYIAEYGQTAVLSPDKTHIFGNLKPGYTNAVSASYNISKLTEKSCSSGFRHNYYWWAGGLGYSTSYDVWSPDSKYVVGVNYPTASDVALEILDPATCYNYDLYKGHVNGAVWFPN